MTLLDALYRELCFGAVLEGLVAADHIHLDMRLHPEPGGVAPWVIFGRITNTEHPNLPYVRDRFEFEVVVPRQNETTTDAICAALFDLFHDKHRTIGAYTEAGVPNGEGLRVRGHHIHTVDNFEMTLQEKSSLMIFALTYLR